MREPILAHRLSVAIIRAAALAAGAVGLAAGGPARAEPAWYEWPRRVATVTLEEAGRDPAGAARRAVAAGDWRPFMTVTFGSRGVDGLDCRIPLPMLDFVTVSRSVSHQPGPRPPSDSIGLVAYNRALLAARGSPLAGICTAVEPPAGSLRTLGSEPPRAWAMIVPPPARRAASLLEAARWGRAAEAAAFPVDPALPEDMFHMNSLAWAVVHGDAALVRRIMAAGPDNGAWCELERRREDGNATRAVAAADPLNLAVSAGRPDMAALIAPVFSQKACASANSHHFLHEAALNTALERRDEAMARILVAQYGPMLHPRRAALAMKLERAGMGAFAADFYFAAAEQAYDHPLVWTSDRCEARAAAFWAAESLARGRRDDLTHAWLGLQRHEWTLGAGPSPPEGFSCAALLDLYGGHGFVIPQDSGLLHGAVFGDRHATGRKATLAEATLFLAVYRRLGGRLDGLAAVRCPLDPQVATRAYCSPGELARGLPQSSIEVGETVFSGLLPLDRPRIERVIENGRRAPPRVSEVARGEAERRGCLIDLADPRLRSRTRACLDRGVTPRFRR